MNQRHILFVCHSLDGSLGGIPRVARAVRAALKHEERLGRLSLQTLTCTVAPPEVTRDEALRSASGSFFRMLIEAWRLSVRRYSLVVYDSANMAQLHQLSPLARCRSLVFLQGIEMWERARPRWVWAARRASFLVSISNFTRSRASRCHGSDFNRARVCLLGTDTDEEPRLVSERSRPRVLIVGRIDRREMYKGHAELIACWPSVLSRVPDAELHIVGRGSGLDTLKAAVPPGLPDRAIVFHGFVDERQLQSLYEQATVFAMPSRGEGFGLVYIEAMRYGLPVITSTEDAGREAIEDGVSGFAVALDRPGELGDRLVFLLTHPREARAMGAAGQARWKRTFTATAFQNRFLTVLNDALSAPPTATTAGR